MDAGDASFVPGDDTVWDAYWLLIGLGGVLGFFEAHLIEDDWSPSGLCFDCDGYELRGDGSWEWPVVIAIGTTLVLISFFPNVLLVITRRFS